MLPAGAIRPLKRHWKLLRLSVFSKRTFFSCVRCGFDLSLVSCERVKIGSLSKVDDDTRGGFNMGRGGVQGGVGGGVGNIHEVVEREARRAGLQPLHCSTL